MAYNNGYYQNYYSQMQQPTQQPMQNNGIIWVQGEAGAKSYLVAPNTTVQLWDSEKQVIYLKSADGSGMPSMKILDYTIRDNQPSSTVELNESEFVTKQEFMEKIDELKKQLEKRDNDESII